MRDTCSTCASYDVHSGTCRKNAPRPEDRRTTLAWPVVHVSQWCREYYEAPCLRCGGGVELCGCEKPGPLPWGRQSEHHCGLAYWLRADTSRRPEHCTKPKDHKGCCGQDPRTEAAQ